MRSRDVRALITCAVLAMAVLSRVELAEAQPGKVSGFATNSVGVMEGKVTDDDGDGIADVEVFITMPDGSELKTKTDDKGKYKIDLGQVQGQKFVFVRQVARINGQVLATTLYEGEEVVEIEESEKPKVMPRPTTATNLILPYTGAAKDENAWARTWLMLDINAQGQVTRMKVLKPAGFGLDEAAVKAAAKLRFQPARGLSGKPVPALVLWDYEWPAYWWLISQKFSLEAVPREADMVPCEGTSAPNSKYFRDCSTADLSKVATAPWIDAIAIWDPPPEAPGPRARRRIHWYEDPLGWVLVGTGVVASGAAVHLYFSAQSRFDEADREPDTVREAQIRSQAEFRETAAVVMGILGVAALGVGTTTLILHTDGHSSGSVAVAGRF
jgi:TonB family protein